jgi:YHS domain-containing protein
MKIRIQFLTVAFVTALAMMVPSATFAETVWADANKVALGGYDVVAYHTTHTATRGSKAHSTQLNEVTLYFVSAENLALFKKEPHKYLPKYGGYCSFGVGKFNVKAYSDPRTFKFHNGKLHLFYNDFHKGKVLNAIVPWNQNENKLAAKADLNWAKIKWDEVKGFN